MKNALSVTFFPAAMDVSTMPRKGYAAILRASLPNGGYVYNKQRDTTFRRVFPWQQQS
jgi:hypothetical protein